MNRRRWSSSRWVLGRPSWVSDHGRLSHPPAGAQVDFYFSDSNLPKDKFLSEKIKNTEGGCE